MKLKANIRIAVTALYLIGAAAILIAYKNGNAPASEWVFDLLSVGLFMCVLASYLSIFIAFPKSWAFIASGVVLYCFGFDMISELIGFNQGSHGKTVFWTCGLITTFIIHYGNKRSNND